MDVNTLNVCLPDGLDGRDSIPGRGKRFFSTLQRPDPLWGSPSLLPKGTGDSFPGSKATGAWNLPLSSSAEVKNGGAIPPLSHTSSWRDACLIKRADNLIFISPIVLILFSTGKIFHTPQLSLVWLLEFSSGTLSLIKSRKYYFSG
jgi:hypothetical protein